MNALVTFPSSEYAKTFFRNLDISEATQKDYIYRIDAFICFIQDKQLTYNSFLDYKKQLANRCDYSTSTKNKYLATARIFLRELHRRGILPVDTTLNIKSFPQSKKHKVTGLDDEDIEKLTSYLRSLDELPKNLRLKAIIALLLFQGLRQIEIVRLDVRDIDYATGRAFIVSKGQNDKEPIYLHPETIKALQRYVKACKKADGALFTPLTNEPTMRLTTRGLRMIVQGAMQTAKINRTVHGFRHYFTTKLIKSYKGDLLRVSSYTRHRSIEMLQVYNDDITEVNDLPNYYSVFSGIAFGL